MQGLAGFRAAWQWFAQFINQGLDDHREAVHEIYMSF